MRVLSSRRSFLHHRGFKPLRRAAFRQTERGESVDVRCPGALIPADARGNLKKNYVDKSRFGPLKEDCHKTVIVQRKTHAVSRRLEGLSGNPHS